jgi:rSAM/selenodomain-associated transferase 1
MRRALIVIAKAPVAGRTKTRLVPPLTPDEAAKLSAAFLQDTVATGLQLEWERLSVIHPRGDGQLLRTQLPDDVRLVEQRGVGLGDALAYAFEHHFDEGFDRVVLIGSDNPTLPAVLIETAVRVLESQRDLSIGPTSDGGYYLIGMRQPYPVLFERIEWSTARVYTQTVERAKQCGLNVHSVAEWYDIDQPLDLDRLESDLRRMPSDVAVRTRATLSELAPLQVGGTSSVGVRPDCSA